MQNMMNSRLEVVVNKLRRVGVRLALSTQVNKELLFDTLKKNIKVVINQETMSFTVIDFDAIPAPRPVACNFWIDPNNVSVAAKVIAYHTKEEVRIVS